MQIDRSLISRLENLARLRLEDSEREALLKDLAAILDLVEKLREVDTEGVQPLEYVHDKGTDPRPDEVKGQVSREEALKNAPDTDGTYFRVPKVIDTDKG